MLGLIFIALASACIWKFSPSGGHGGLLLWTVIVTSPPAPGVSLTDWKSCCLGYLIQPGLTNPSALPGRSGGGPCTGINVGSLPSATLGWEFIEPVAAVEAAVGA